MRKSITRTSLAVLLMLNAACGAQHATFVKADTTALGRVVVYRNGIAYYERRATVDGDKLTLRVPADKVDDFLKSLTVADAKTGQALPISFPSPSQAVSGNVDMTIQLPDTSHRDLILSYVTEAPAWKPSYRVVVDESGKVDLQAWAIVDNTSGEDWTAVKVGVGSSSALSFRYDLHSIRTVHRETLQTEDTFAKAPPRGGSVMKNDVAGKDLVLAQLDDADIPRQAGHPDVAREMYADAAEQPAADKKSFAHGAKAKEESYMRGGGGGRAAAGVAPSVQASPAKSLPKPNYKMAAGVGVPRDEAMDDAKISALATALKQRKSAVVIEGYAGAGESDGNERGLDRANMMRNQLIDKGVPPAQLQVASRGAVAGQKAGVRLVEAKNAPSADNKGDDNGNPVGESHFESQSPMTVGKGTSAMVSIMQGKAPGEVVYLYDAEDTHGDGKYAFRSVRFRNVTTSTLESGPITVYGSGRFIGEGLTDPVPPGAVAVVPFALDRQIVVEKDAASGDKMSKLIKLNRGVLTAEVAHSKTTKLKVTNRQNSAQVVLVRHTVPKGWNLTKAPKVAEQYGDSRLFLVELAPHESKYVEIEETTPMTRTVDLRSPTGVDLVREYLEGIKENGQVLDGMKRLLRLYDEMQTANETIVSLRERGEEFRQRMDELHGQLFSLKAVKTAGSLMTHLQQKMKEISDRVNNNTLAIVQQQERLMMAKVKFHDELSELSLEKKVEQTAKR